MSVEKKLKKKNFKKKIFFFYSKYLSKIVF